MPDYGYVHKELAKAHVTLKLLWEEYVQSCMLSGNRFYMETQFRHYYHKYARVHKASIRLEHKPALSAEVDWAGTKIGFFYNEIGKLYEASLFVMVLPCRQLIIDRRHNHQPTIIVSQFQPAEWPEQISVPVAA